VGSVDDIRQVTDFETVGAVSSGPEGVEHFHGDILSPDVCIEAVQGCDRVVHLAAHTGVGPSVEDPRMDMEQNILGTFNMLEAARTQAVDKFVFASSGAVVGNVEEPPIHEELVCHPTSPYGASKLTGEAYCNVFWHSYGVNTACLRFGNVYGPGSHGKQSVIAKFIKRACQGLTCEVYGDGGQTRDFIYVDDLCDAIVASCGLEQGGEVFQIASGSELSLTELTAALGATFESVTGKQMHFENTAERKGDVRRNFSNTGKAERVLGWTPQTQLTEGLEKTVRYLSATV